MNNYRLYELLHLVANKDVFSGFLTPAQFELELVSKNIRLMRNLLGLPERYQPGTMQAGASASRTIEIDLLPFLKNRNVVISSQETSLSDWYYINDWYTDDSKSAEIISQQELGMRINHPIRKATIKYPFAIIISKGLRVWPDTVERINISYYRTPEAPTFATKVNATTGALEYDGSNSNELEWADHNKLDILYMIMQDIGVNIERPDLEQLANKLVETGK